MGRRPEIGNVQLYPNRPLRADDKNGYVLKFYCPIRGKRIRRNCGTRDRREARRILRECRERLLNGKYIESGGAITITQAQSVVRSRLSQILTQSTVQRTWHECFDDYYQYREQRSREKSLTDAASRIEIAGRILDADRRRRGLAPDGPIAEYATLTAMELLQEQLLSGEEGRFENRAAMTVNTMVGAVLAFLRYCKRHGWINEMPQPEKLDVDEVMKGRPISNEEFNTMLEATPDVVGKRQAESWTFVLKILWESAFRVGDGVNFSWDDERRIHPVWPSRANEYPTIAIPSTQKNKKAQEIPMLPGLQAVMETVPTTLRRGWVVNPVPLDHGGARDGDWFKPIPHDFVALAKAYTNSAIARACCVSETAVRKWIRSDGIERSAKRVDHTGNIPQHIVAQMRARAEEVFNQRASSVERRLTAEYVSQIISEIGRKAGVVVQPANVEAGRRIKYASAHDLRRSCAYRLINAGISAETLRIILRHKDFKTTERFYGAIRQAQSAATELHQKLAVPGYAGQLGGEKEQTTQLNDVEVERLRAILRALV